jgi:hypothetical protein
MSVKISELTASTGLSSADIIPVVDNSDSQTQKATLQQVLNYVTGSTFNTLSVTTANITSITGTLTGNVVGTSSYSENSNLLDGLNSTDFARLSQNNTFTGITTFTNNITGTSAYFSGDLYVNGTASIGFLNTVSQSSLVIGDKYITILSGGTDHVSLDGSGILWGSGGVGPTVNELGANAHLRYRNSIDSLEIFPGLYVSGSTKFGNDSSDTHQFSGSILLSGTLTANNTISGTLATFTTISASSAEVSGNLVIYGSASLAEYPDYAYVLYTASYDKIVVYPGLYVNGNLTGSGNASFQAVSGTTAQFTSLTGRSLTALETFQLSSSAAGNVFLLYDAGAIARIESSRSEVQLFKGSTTTTASFANDLSNLFVRFPNINGVVSISGLLTGTTTQFTTVSASNLFISSSGNAVIDVSSSSSALRITQRGTGESIRVEDSTNPDSTPFVITADGKVGVGVSLPSKSLHINNSGLLIGGTNVIDSFPFEARLIVDSSGSTGHTLADFRNNNGSTLFVGGTNIGIGTSTPTSAKLEISASLLTTTKNAIYSDSILPNPGSTFEIANYFKATSAGSNNSRQAAFYSDLAPGTTANALITSMWAQNTAAGTGQSPTNLLGSTLQANYGIFYYTAGATSGYNVGASGYSSDSTTRNIGVIGMASARTSAGATTDAIGVYGKAGQHTAGTVGARVAGMFTLYDTDSIGTITDSALIIDNADKSAPILLARDNGSEVFRIADGGNVGIGNTTPNAKLDVNGDTILSGNLTVTGSIFVSGSSIYGQVAELTSSATNYTLVRQDSGKFLNVNSGSAVTVTVPTGLPTGFTVSLCQLGAGQITVSGAVGVTINNRQSHTKTAGQYAVVSLVGTSADTYVFVGDTTI